MSETAVSTATPAAGPPIVLNDGTSPARLAALVREMSNLPVFPAAGLKLLDALRSPSYSVRQLSDIISSDVGMAARVLSMANSTRYGIKHRVATVSHAVMMLGAEEIEHLAMTLCFLQVSPPRVSIRSPFSPTRYIEHSMFVGRVAQHLAGALGFQLVGRGEAYAAALLHDIGLYVLYRYHRELLHKAVRHAAKWKTTQLRAEIETIGATHAALGAWLAQRWNIPRPLCEAIAYHHQAPPADSMAPELLTVLKLAKRVALEMNVRNGLDELPEELDGGSLHLLRRRGWEGTASEITARLRAEHGRVFEAHWAGLQRLLHGFRPAGGRRVGDLENAEEQDEESPEDGLLARMRRWFGI